MRQPGKLHLFDGYGVELEYMIVDRHTLAVAPLADQVLQAQAGSLQNQVEVGTLCWSNELVLHVIELKTNGPARSLKGLADQFQDSIGQVEAHLAALGGRLMPGGMHPWMDPLTETRLWPHGDSSIYEAYNRIFGCQGHGWSNLQSSHLNLPFQGDEEFGRLHAAIRLLLPLLRKIPQIAGTLIPEPAFTRAAYQQQVLEPIYQAIAPYDPDALLQEEWLNSRGAIARFDRSSIEIRLLDIQECPKADLAIIDLLCSVLKAFVEERWSSYEEQKSWAMGPLAKWLAATIGDAGKTRIHAPGYLNLFGFAGKQTTMGELWQHLAGALRPELIARKDQPLSVILNQGTLARRILKTAGTTPTRLQLADIYGRLCDCLSAGEMFHA